MNEQPTPPSGPVRPRSGTLLPHLPLPRQPIRWRRVLANVWYMFWPQLHAGQSDAERNLAMLRVSPFWSSVLNAAVSFNSTFAVRLGASNQLIGLLSSVPALLVVLLTLPAARFLEGRQDRLRWIAGSVFVYRLGYLAIALMPFFVREHRAEVFVAIILLSQVVLAPNNAGWNALLADMVPPEKRAPLFAYRNILFNAGTAVITPLIGRMLDRVVFPLGYQIAYGLGFAIALINSWLIFGLRPPPPVAPPPRAATRQPWSKERIRALAAANRPYIRMVVNTLVLDMGAWLVGPLYMIYYLRHLGASDSWVGTATALSTVSVMVGYYIWQKVIRRQGESKVLRWTVLSVGFYPLAVALTPSLSPLLLAVIINGVLTPGIGLSHFNILLQVCPAERRASYTSLYTVLMNAGAFVAPMVGVALAGAIGFKTVFIIGALLRTLGAILFWVWPVPAPEIEPATARP